MRFSPLLQSDRERLRRLIRKAITQGPRHVENMIDIFEIIREEWAKEFFEDNRTAQDGVLRECYTEAKKRHLRKGYSK